MNRRHALWATASLLALTGGISWNAWLRHRGAFSTAAGPAPDASFWQLAFETATGGPPIQLSAFQGQLLLINFWATWCPPCVKEFPLLDAFHRQHRAAGWQVLGLAIDSPTPVKEFLAKQAVQFPVGQAGLTGIDLSKNLGNSTGALPFTVVIDRQGRRAAHQLGSLTEAQLSDWAAQIK